MNRSTVEMNMLTKPISCSREAARVCIAGSFPPDGSVRFRWRPHGEERWHTKQTFTAPGTVEGLLLEPGEICFAFTPSELHDILKVSIDLSTSINPVSKVRKRPTESQRLEALIADTMGHVVALERRVKQLESKP